MDIKWIRNSLTDETGEMVGNYTITPSGRISITVLVNGEKREWTFSRLLPSKLLKGREKLFDGREYSIGINY